MFPSIIQGCCAWSDKHINGEEQCEELCFHIQCKFVKGDMEVICMNIALNYANVSEVK